ncbi:MAG: AraC family transcriptional regulator, partial [Planctomycetes bacterium]|nr:AraC family transcriptional regulator [Planctomycetota bacterium]
YLPISKSNIEWDLYLTGAGVADIPPDEKYPAKGHPGTYDFTWENSRVLAAIQTVRLISRKLCK